MENNLFQIIRESLKGQYADVVAAILPGGRVQGGEYAYRNAQGEELFYVLRYDEPNSNKSIRPVCYCADRDGNRQWCFKMPKEPRPLYGPDRLGKAAPEAAVLLVEGEKTADAAQRLFPEYVCMTWSGGSNAVALTDYSPIAGRDIAIWPDNDAPGLKAALNLLRCIEAENEKKEIPAEKAQIAPFRRIILPPENLPPKWDFAGDRRTTSTLLSSCRTRWNQANSPKRYSPATATNSAHSRLST